MTAVLRVRLQAPFGAFRWMQAGVYRATSPVIPPSTAWGLLLGIAGIDVRSPGVPTTLIRDDAPSLELAVGVVRPAEVSTLYQQLHGYPVGKDAGKAFKIGARGAKYQIAPVRREVLVGLDMMIAVRGGASEVIERIRMGLAGAPTGARYGLPFAGDNNFLIDRMDVAEPNQAATWYRQVGSAAHQVPGSCRLTVAIDRADSSRTQTPLFAPSSFPSAEPPPEAWQWVPRTIA